MPKAYWIAHVTITDPARYAGYQALAPRAFEKYGGKFLARGGKSEICEGHAFERHVIIEFENFEQAQACYASHEYKAAKSHRVGACDVHVILVEAIP